MKITQEKIDQYVDEMLTIFKDDSETIDSFKRDYQKSKKNIQIDYLNYCIIKYINSELDFETKGINGLGRSSDFWPRLGGYFRDNISQLTTEKIEQLYLLILSLITKSYLFQILLSDIPKEISKINTSEELYKKWIPKIYIFDINIIPEDSKNFLFATIENDIELLKKFFKENDMRVSIFSPDKTLHILNGYILAGITLRIAEELED